jgi:hypothetical protein
LGAASPRGASGGTGFLLAVAFAFMCFVFFDIR